MAVYGSRALTYLEGIILDTLICQLHRAELHKSHLSASGRLPSESNMHRFSRELQHRILLRLAEIFPNHVDPQKEFADVDNDVLGFNLSYLRGHQLIQARILRINKVFSADQASITVKGLDLLSGDDGIACITKRPA